MQVNLFGEVLRFCFILFWFQWFMVCFTKFFCYISNSFGVSFTFNSPIVYLVCTSFYSNILDNECFLSIYIPLATDSLPFLPLLDSNYTFQIQYTSAKHLHIHTRTLVLYFLLPHITFLKHTQRPR